MNKSESARVFVYRIEKNLHRDFRRMKRGSIQCKSMGESLMMKIQILLRAGDSFAAMEYIQQQGTPLEISARYDELLLDLYWKSHDLPAAITICRAGIHFCLGQSLNPQNSPETTAQFRSAAKRLAYNAGSFTWPGWEEPGINPTAADLLFGRDCAGLNLRLAIEMNKPPKAISMAHWLVGAHAISSEPAKAELHFQSAIEAYPAHDEASKAMELCNRGYLAIARLAVNSSSVESGKLLDEMLDQLKTMKHEDADGYLGQLASARRLFVHPA